ncbi:MAG: CHAD domain-containing protein [Methanomassiliicoccales archaeon]|nr:CHAD domain-containing protein [Methanomassiliicoccales archaeon]
MAIAVDETDARYCSLAREAMRRQLSRLTIEARGVLSDEDAECVHRMRVASRRMRAALAVFEGCFPRKRLKRWSERMKTVTKALGAARDADVQIMFLEGMLKDSGIEVRPGIEGLLRLKRLARKRLHPPLTEAIEGLLEGGELEEMTRAARRVEEAPKGTYARSRALAYVHIGRRTAELGSFSPYVHDPTQKDRHHQMRIAAKRLRYTLELFGGLYAGGLLDELSKVKKLQEVLGEMHDCDVWVQELEAKLGRKGGNVDAMRPGLAMVLDDRKRTRDAMYREFVALWEGLEREHVLDAMLDRIEKRAAPGLRPEEAFATRLERNPSTKVALIGDVHGNFHALRAVLEDAARNGATLLLNTGDIVGYGPCPEETVELLRKSGAIGVVGNFDLKVLRSRNAGEVSDKESWYAEGWTYRRLSADSKKYLASLPRSVSLDVAGRRVLVVHGSPDSMDEYVDPNTSKKRLKQLAETTDADVLIAGHAHRPLDKEVGGTRFINPGSVGRQDDGDPRATYAIMALEPLSVEHRRVKYDVEAAVKAMRSRGLPRMFERTLTEGRSLSFLKEKQRGGRATQTPMDAVAACWELQREYLDGDEHSHTVAHIALRLFDCLSGLHGFADEERRLLECAAACHDLGWIEGLKGHHKASMRIVIEAESLPFKKRERAIVALVARYHRKALPDKRHAHYCNLDRKDRLLVDTLAAVLRLADGLDSSHQSVVASVGCDHDADRIILHLAHKEGAEMEKNDARKKGDLMTRVFERELVLVWEGS